MERNEYIMEHAEEAYRLDLKTGSGDLNRQALWAGLRPGMRVADVGCGSGKTTELLSRLIQPSGTIVGVDASPERVGHASNRYGREGIEFVRRDFYHPLDDLGQFDFIWVRFVLEYHRAHSFKIVSHLADILKPGGILCLIDLDHNCLNHFGLSARLEKAILEIMDLLREKRDFDPYIGRKLYSYLYDLEFTEIDVSMGSHHLIYGELNNVDSYNWTQKVEVAAKNSGYGFADYPGGYEEFLLEFKSFFSDPRRFTYTPLIACRGRKRVM